MSKKTKKTEVNETTETTTKAKAATPTLKGKDVKDVGIGQVWMSEKHPDRTYVVGKVRQRDGKEGAKEAVVVSELGSSSSRGFTMEELVKSGYLCVRVLSEKELAEWNKKEEAEKPAEAKDKAKKPSDKVSKPAKEKGEGRSHETMMHFVNALAKGPVTMGEIKKAKWNIHNATFYSNFKKLMEQDLAKKEGDGMVLTKAGMKKFAKA